MPRLNGLSVKQEKFINEFIKNKGNATQAAIKAGYSKKNADVIGAQNLVKLRNHIDVRLSKKKAKDIMGADEIMELLTKHARGKMKEEQIIVEGKGDGLSQAKVMKKQIAPKDQLSALDKLARIRGLYNDKVEINTSTNEVDMHLTTLNALKNRKVADFDEEVASEE